jgi:hypothetical protein
VKYKCYKCGIYKVADFVECNNIVKERIPDSIIHLTLGDNFILPIYGRVPKSVTHLSVSIGYLLCLYRRLPSSVVYLIVRCNEEYRDGINKYIKGNHKFVQKLEIRLPDQRSIYYEC